MKKSSVDMKEESKLKLLIEIITRARQYRSVEKAILELVDGVSIIGFIRNRNIVWEKVFEFFGDGYVMMGIARLLRHVEKDVERVTYLCEKLIPIAQTELRIKNMHEELVEKFYFRICLLSTVLGLSFGILLGLFMIIPIAKFLHGGIAMLDYIVTLLITLVGVIISCHKVFHLMDILTYWPEKKLGLWKPMLLLVTSFMISLASTFIILH